MFSGQNVELSEQQLVDCSGKYGNHGCNGGWPEWGVHYFVDHGAASESEYPYKAKNQKCAQDGGSFKVSAYKQTAKGDCNDLREKLQAQPISVTVDARNWSSYRSGVLKTCGTGIDHAVLLVGWVDGNWKIKNSWGSSWGEQGFIRLDGSKGGVGTCGVCERASTYIPI